MVQTKVEWDQKLKEAGSKPVSNTSSTYAYLMLKMFIKVLFWQVTTPSSYCKDMKLHGDHMTVDDFPNLAGGTCLDTGPSLTV